MKVIDEPSPFADAIRFSASQTASAAAAVATARQKRTAVVRAGQRTKPAPKGPARFRKVKRKPSGNRPSILISSIPVFIALMAVGTLVFLVTWSQPGLDVEHRTSSIIRTLAIRDVSKRVGTGRWTRGRLASTLSVPSFPGDFEASPSIYDAFLEPNKKCLLCDLVVDEVPSSAHPVLEITSDDVEKYLEADTPQEDRIPTINNVFVPPFIRARMRAAHKLYQSFKRNHPLTLSEKTKNLPIHLVYQLLKQSEDLTAYAFELVSSCVHTPQAIEEACFSVQKFTGVMPLRPHLIAKLLTTPKVEEDGLLEFANHLRECEVLETRIISSLVGSNLGADLGPYYDNASLNLLETAVSSFEEILVNKNPSLSQTANVRADHVTRLLATMPPVQGSLGDIQQTLLKLLWDQALCNVSLEKLCLFGDGLDPAATPLDQQLVYLMWLVRLGYSFPLETETDRQNLRAVLIQQGLQNSQAALRVLTYATQGAADLNELAGQLLPLWTTVLRAYEFQKLVGKKMTNTEAWDLAIASWDAVGSKDGSRLPECDAATSKENTPNPPVYTFCKEGKRFYCLTRKKKIEMLQYDVAEIRRYLDAGPNRVDISPVNYIAKS
eukprot:GHVT01008589.1.p1 GENE.GHVT01008589.1~~GHVT01008589.1.p1  ORF type:complete len:608 (-),score=98.19 GHVT01008589.1:62-1885(-)